MHFQILMQNNSTVKVVCPKNKPYSIAPHPCITQFRGTNPKIHIKIVSEYSRILPLSI